MTITELVDDLRLARDAEPFDIRRFDEILVKLHELGTPDIIAPLLGEFRDDADHHAMFSMLHTVESFEAEAYVTGVVEGMPALAAASTEWLDTLVLRVLNCDSHYRLLLERITGETVDALVRAADGIEKASPEAREKIAKLRSDLKAQ